MKKRDFPPIHPGEILVKEFLEPLKISQYRLAKDIGVTASEILQDKMFILFHTRHNRAYFGMTKTGTFRF